MATKTSKLHTTFTGDDKQFQRTAGRIAKSGAKMGAMAGQLKGAFAAMGGAFVIKGIVEQFDRIGKLAKRFDMTAETMQRLGHVAAIGGADLETVGKAMKTLNSSAADARAGLETYNREFKVLGINAQEFFALNHEERWLAISDAVKNTTDRNAAMASVTKLMGRAGAEVFTILEQGGAVTREVMDSITVASNATVKAMEEVNDKLTEISTQAKSTFANVLVDAFDVVEKKAAKVSAGILILLNALGLGDDLSARDIGTGLAKELGLIAPPDDGKAAEIPAWMPDSARDEKEALKDFGGMVDAMKAQEKASRDMVPADLIAAAKTKQLVGELAAKEMTRQLLEGVAPGHIAPGITERKEPSKSMTSGKFSEFLQTAGLGGTSYIRTTPAMVQLQKQTKLSEKMAKSLDEFNASLDDLLGNTVER